MNKKCNVIIRKTIYEPLQSCPFPDNIGIRELARASGYDPSYLSRVKRGIIPVTEETLRKIEAAVAKVVA